MSLRDYRLPQHWRAGGGEAADSDQLPGAVWWKIIAWQRCRVLKVRHWSGWTVTDHGLTTGGGASGPLALGRLRVQQPIAPAWAVCGCCVWGTSGDSLCSWTSTPLSLEAWVWEAGDVCWAIARTTSLRRGGGQREHVAMRWQRAGIRVKRRCPGGRAATSQPVARRAAAWLRLIAARAAAAIAQTKKLWGWHRNPAGRAASSVPVSSVAGIFAVISPAS